MGDEVGVVQALQVDFGAGALEGGSHLLPE